MLISEKQVTSRILSDMFNVSTRSIRYDLEMIEYAFKKWELTLENHRINGIAIKGNQQIKTSLLAYISDSEIQLGLAEKIIAHLMLENITTVMELAALFHVSRNKIVNTLPDVEEALQQVNLFLDKRPSVGMALKADELTIRLALFKLSTPIRKYIAEKLMTSHQKTIANAITSYQKATGITFSDQGIHELTLTLCYQQLRIEKNGNITYPYDVTKEGINSENFQMIMTCFQTEKIVLTVEEGIFVLHQIRNTQMIYFPIEKKNSDVHHQAARLAQRFASEASQRFGVALIDNHVFLNALTLHLNVALHRLNTGNVIHNSLTESVKYKYRFIFETCKQIIMNLEKEFEYNFPDDEIAYIAMHVGACCEMSQRIDDRPKALVVCHSGLATSTLLVSRLKSMLPELSILGPVGISEITDERIDEVDFIVSTIHLDISDKKLIVVNPLLGIDDVMILKKCVINITSNKQLSYLLTDHEKKPLQLGDLLTETQIQLKQSLNSWRQGIKQAAMPLLQEGYIKESYVEAMIEAVEEFGPYMVFIPNIAIVHAAPSAGILKEGLSVLTLDKPLILGETGQVLVSCFIVLATLDKASQLFMNLISILGSNENVMALLTCGTVKQVLELGSVDESDTLKGGD